MELWGRPGAMGQGWSCGSGLWVRAVRPPSRPTHVGRCGSELSVQPPDPHMWGAVGQSFAHGLQTHTCGALWGRPGAMGQGYGSGLGLWGRPGAVGQEWSYGAGLWLWGRPGPMGQGYGAGLGLWGRPGAARAASRPTHVGRCGSELCIRPPDPQLWGAMGQRCACGLQTHTCGALWVRAVGRGLQTHSCGALWVSAVRAASRPTDMGCTVGQAWGYGA